MRFWFLNMLWFHVNVAEVAHYEVIKRLMTPHLAPAGDRVPDPRKDYNACVEACVKMVRGALDQLDETEHKAYFQKIAKEAVKWCIVNGLPIPVRKHFIDWNIQIGKQTKP